MESDFYQAHLKQARRCLKAGDLWGALFFLDQAKEGTGVNTGPHKYKAGILVHRKAVIHAEYGEPENARQYFEKAVAMVKSDAAMERAMVLRDFGNFELRQGNVAIGRKKIERALLLLDHIAEQTPRVEIEQAVTRGFLARTTIEIDPSGSLEILREVATILKGYKKRDYELDNLDWLIDHLPFGYERQQLIVRAVYLCVLMGHNKRAGEFSALLGGKPLRKVYRFIL